MSTTPTSSSSPPSSSSSAAAPREAVLLLEDGTLFRGRSIAGGTAVGEVVFNTAMTGYQEILTDPSYRRQIVVMTQPHIGNYGTRDADAESSRPWAEGFIARRVTPRASGTGSERDLGDYLGHHGVPTMDGLDTRALVRRLREHGAMRGVLSDRVDDLDALRRELDACPPMAGRALVDEVTPDGERVVPPDTIPPDGRERCHVALYDFGAKANIVRELTRRGARVTVLPARTPATRVDELEADGVMLSNGPGDPEPLNEIVAEVRRLIAAPKRPLFGICLGHQLLGLALGGRTFKLKFGHHGGNQPVLEQTTGKVTITSQNHGFALDSDSLPPRCRVTHINLNDRTVEGLELTDGPIFSVQYHPEAAPGPHDAAALFDRFLADVDTYRRRRSA